jgi:hypothetical protein
MGIRAVRRQVDIRDLSTVVPIVENPHVGGADRGSPEVAPHLRDLGAMGVL